MPQITFKTTVRTGDDLKEVTVTAHVILDCQSWDEPPCGDIAEIESVTDSNGKQLDLTDEQYDLLESEAIQRVYDDMELAYEQIAESFKEGINY